MRSAVLVSSLAALAGFAAAIDIDIPDDIKLEDLVASGAEIIDSIATGAPEAIPDEVQSLIPTDLVTAPEPTSSGDADSGSLPGLVDQLPRCAVGCLERAAENINCGTTEFTCLCNNAEALGEQMLSCITGGDTGCSITDALSAGRVAPQICERVNNNPDAAELSSASRIVEQAIETGGANASNDDDDNGSSMVGVSAGLLGSALLVAMAL